MAQVESAWLEAALRACLAHLPYGATEGAHVVVIDSWIDSHALCFVYRCPWFDGTVGLRVGPSHPDMWGGTPEDPEGFGSMVADFELGEPWTGGAHPRWLLATDGVRWWGDVSDLPPVAPER
jgi:hypothetical protein